MRETADYIRDTADAERARKWKNGVIEAIKSLAEMPLRCALAQESQDVGVELRHLIYLSHRILFRVQEATKTVDVLRVYHSARAPLQLDDLP